MLTPEEERMIAAIGKIMDGFNEIIHVIDDHADERYALSILEKNRQYQSLCGRSKP